MKYRVARSRGNQSNLWIVKKICSEGRQNASVQVMDAHTSPSYPNYQLTSMVILDDCKSNKTLSKNGQKNQPMLIPKTENATNEHNSCMRQNYLSDTKKLPIQYPREPLHIATILTEKSLKITNVSWCHLLLAGHKIQDRILQHRRW